MSPSTSGLLVAQFVTEDTLASAAIRYLSASHFSHVDLVVSLAQIRAFASFVEDRPTRIALSAWHEPEGLLGARWSGGVQVRRTNYAKFSRRVRKGCVVPRASDGLRFAFQQIGKPYAKRKILDFFLHKFGRDNVFDPDQPGWFCDELNYEIFAQAGKLLLDDRNPCNLSPQCEYLSPCLRVQAG